MDGGSLWQPYRHFSASLWAALCREWRHHFVATSVQSLFQMLTVCSPALWKMDFACLCVYRFVWHRILELRIDTNVKIIALLTSKFAGWERKASCDASRVHHVIITKASCETPDLIRGNLYVNIFLIHHLIEKYGGLVLQRLSSVKQHKLWLSNHQLYSNFSESQMHSRAPIQSEKYILK